MIYNYLLIALRNFKRQRLFAFLNMFGLALGLASAILIFLYVSDELQYDTMHPYYHDTYRIGCTWTNADGRVFENEVSPGYWVKYLKDTRSEITHATRIDYIGYPTSLHDKTRDKIILTEEICWSEPNFKEILSFDLVKGDEAQFFENHNTMVISETGSKKLFGSIDPVGQVITVKHNWATRDREIDVMVTGVYRDYPSNSHFKPHYILNINAQRNIQENFDSYFEGQQLRDASFFQNYIVVKPAADVSQIENALQALSQQMTQTDSSAVAAGWTMTPFLTKLSDVHFDQEVQWEWGGQGDKKYLTIFSSVAILILLIACINYMNLATARAARRSKEVGLRKAVGSERKQIAIQFFFESFLMTLGALIMSILLVIIFLQPFNQLAHKSFTLLSLLNPYMIGIVALILIFMAFVAGSYPAFYLSSFKPAEVLKGQVVHGTGAELFRKSLVMIQYTVALILIISTFVVVRQMEHMQGTKLNQQGDQLLSIRYGGIAPQERFAAFKQAVLRDPDIEHVTMANHLPRLNHFGWIGTTVKFPEFQDKELQWNQLNVDFDFAKTYDLEFIAGRDFDANNTADSSSVILNEAAVKALNQSIEKILGASVIEIFNNGSNNRAFKVIGIVKDFPFRSMHQAIEPLMLNPKLHFIDRIAYVKLPAGKFQEKLNMIEKTWKEFYPSIGFDYWFVSDEFNRMYLSETRVSSLAKSFSALAILITILGVFGLASYTSEQKRKEVGIRKVMGASVWQIVVMFAWLFVKILLVACLIALPAAYFMADQWLEGFVYRSPLSPLVFIASLIGLLLITLFTVSYETFKAAQANPVKSLRSE